MSRRAGQSGTEPSQAQVRLFDADLNSARWLSDVRRAAAERLLVTTTQWPLADGTRLLPVDTHWSVLSPTMHAVLNQRMAAELTSSPDIIGSPRDARLGSALVRRRRA